MVFEESLLIDKDFSFSDSAIIYVFGTGVDAEEANKKINREIKAFIDNHRNGDGFEFYGKPILSFEQYKKVRTENDIIVIATYRFCREIGEQLQREGLLGGKDYYIWDDQYLFHEDDVTGQFISFMKDIWSEYRVKEIKDDAKVLLPFENRHDTAAIVYAYCGNYFAQKHNAKIEAYLRFGMMADDKSPVIEKIYRAFNVDTWVDPVLNSQQEKEAEEIINRIWPNLNTWEDWKNIYIYNIHFGTTMIRHFLRVYIPTFDLRDEKMHAFLKLAVSTIVFWYHYINENNFKVVLLGDGANWDGYIRDIAITKEIPAYALSYTMKKLKYDFAEYESYLYFDKFWDQLSEEEKEAGIEWSKKEIEKKMKGLNTKAASLLDNRNIFNQPIVKNKVLEHNDKIKVVIFAHIFEEDGYPIGTHIFDNNVFSWLCHLGELSEKTPDYDWYLKIHPDATRRDFIIYKMIIQKYPKIKLIDAKVSPYQLKAEGVKIALTVFGTIGQEYPLIGIPVVTAGDNPYSCYSFTVNPKTKDEYDDVINHLEDLSPNISLKEIYEFYAVNYLYYNWKVVDFCDFFKTDDLSKSYDQLDRDGASIGSWRYKKYMELWTKSDHEKILSSLEGDFLILDRWRPDILYRKNAI